MADGQGMPQTFTLDEKTVQMAMQAAGIYKENIYSLDTEQRMKLWKRLGEMGVIPGQQFVNMPMNRYFNFHYRNSAN